MSVNFLPAPRLKPQQLIAKLKETARGWKFDRAAIGFPAPVRKERIAKDPKHLGKGWIGFNFARALGIPVRVVNDAALQAARELPRRADALSGARHWTGICIGLGQYFDAA
jgi:predicted NBD/HSP70 family sugar kinase